MARDRGQRILFYLAVGLGLICVGGAVWAVRATRPVGPAISADHHPGDLVIDFTGRTGSAAVPWRLEGKTDFVRRTDRGLLILAGSVDDPPRLVLQLEAPEQSFGLLEVTMALNKGKRGRVWTSRYPDEPPGPSRSRSFDLEPGLGLQTYRVLLGAGEHRGAPLHSLTIQLTDAPVRAVVQRVRLTRTNAWRSYADGLAGAERVVVLGGIGIAATPAPEHGPSTIETRVPLVHPRLHLAFGIHPLQQLFGRPEVGFRVLLRPLDRPLDESATTLFEQLVDPSDPEQRRWFFQDLDLSPWAGRQIRLDLEVLTWQRAGEDPWELRPGRPAWALPFWGPLRVSGGPSADAPSPAGMVLLLLDGVARDELGCYGGSAGFPGLGRLFRGTSALCDAYLVEYDRERFLHSLFTGDYPGLEADLEPEENLVAWLHDAGFRTAAFFSGDHAGDLLAHRGLQAGFELTGSGDVELGLPPPRGGEWPDSPLLHGLPGPLTWLEQLGDEPFFLVVHLSAGKFKARDRPDRLAAVDRAVAKLAAALRASGRFDDTLLCLSGLWGPVYSARVDRAGRLLDEAARVPLLFKSPTGDILGPDPGRIFRSIDILPTLCGLAGLDTVAHQGDGRSLSRWLLGETTDPWPVEEVYLHHSRADRRYLGLRHGPLKLIWRTEPRTAPVCYDLEADPGEWCNIAPGGPPDNLFYSTAPLGRERYTELLHRLESHFGPLGSLNR